MENIQNNLKNKQDAQSNTLELVENNDYTIDALLNGDNPTLNQIFQKTEETKKEETPKKIIEVKTEEIIAKNSESVVREEFINKEPNLPPDIQEEIVTLSQPLRDLYKAISSNYN